MKKIKKALEKLLKKIKKLNDNSVGCVHSSVVHKVIFGDRVDPLKSFKRLKKEVNY